MALQQVEPASSKLQGKRTSDRNRRSPSYYGFDNSFSDSTTTAPTKRLRRAGGVENFQRPSASVVETVQNIAIQQTEETNNSPVIGEVSPLDPRVRPLIYQQTPTLEDDVRSLTVFEAENLEINERLLPNHKAS